MVRWRTGSDTAVEQDLSFLLREVCAGVLAGGEPYRQWELACARRKVPVRGGDVAAVERAVLMVALAHGEVPWAALRAISAALRLCDVSGSDVVATLSAVADGLEEDARVEVERQAVLAGPVASARLLAGLPVAGMVACQLVGLGTFRILFMTVLGWFLLGVGAALLAFGYVWSRAYVRDARAAGRVDAGVSAHMVVVLLFAALRSGHSLPGALSAVGVAAKSPALVRYAQELAGGGVCAGVVSRSWAGVVDGVSVDELRQLLGPAWRDGSAPEPVLVAAAAAACRPR